MFGNVTNVPIALWSYMNLWPYCFIYGHIDVHKYHLRSEIIFSPQIGGNPDNIITMLAFCQLWSFVFNPSQVEQQQDVVDYYTVTWYQFLTRTENSYICPCQMHVCIQIHTK